MRQHVLVYQATEARDKPRRRRPPTRRLHTNLRAQRTRQLPRTHRRQQLRRLDVAVRHGRRPRRRRRRCLRNRAQHRLADHRQLLRMPRPSANHPTARHPRRHSPRAPSPAPAARRSPLALTQPAQPSPPTTPSGRATTDWSTSTTTPPEPLTQAPSPEPACSQIGTRCWSRAPCGTLRPHDLVDTILARLLDERGLADACAGGWRWRRPGQRSAALSARHRRSVWTSRPASR
jgi:hypothetical protein